MKKLYRLTHFVLLFGLCFSAQLMGMEQRQYLTTSLEQNSSGNKFQKWSGNLSKNSGSFFQPLPTTKASFGIMGASYTAHLLATKYDPEKKKGWVRPLMNGLLAIGSGVVAVIF